MTKQAILIKHDGTIEEVAPDPSKGNSFHLEQLYKLIGCEVIQVIPTNDNRLMIMDENGKLTGQPENPKATELVDRVIASTDFVVGNVVVCSRRQFT